MTLIKRHSPHPYEKRIKKCWRCGEEFKQVARLYKSGMNPEYEFEPREHPNCPAVDTLKPD